MAENRSPENEHTFPGRRVGLALGAGGSSGSAFIAAALAQLEDATGFDAARSTSIVGTSAGAFRTARIDVAATPPDDLILEQLRRLTNNDEWVMGRAETLVAPVRLLAAKVIALLAPTTGRDATWSVAPPPFHGGAVVVTVELRRGRRGVHRLSEIDEPARAVLASGAVPGITKPVQLAGRRHIDGAVHSPTNVDLLAPAELDLLIVVAPMVPRNGGNLLGRIHRSLLRHELREWQRAKQPVIVIAPSSDDRRNRKDPERFGAAATPAVARLTTRRP